MGFFGDLWDALVEGIKGIWRMCVKVVKAVVNFFADIFNWLRGFLDGIDDDDKDCVVFDFAELIKEAKEQGNAINLGLKGKRQIGAAVFNNRTGEIEALKSIDADSCDNKTSELLSGRKLVVIE